MTWDRLKQWKLPVSQAMTVFCLTTYGVKPLKMEVPTFSVCAVIQIPLYARLGLLYRELYYYFPEYRCGLASLRHGYLFRPTYPQGSVLDKPFLSSTAESRLNFYLEQAKIDEGESLHRFRSGCLDSSFFWLPSRGY